MKVSLVLTGGVMSLVVLECSERGEDRSEGDGLALAEWMPLLRPPEPFSVWYRSMTWNEGKFFFIIFCRNVDIIEIDTMCHKNPV